MQFGFDYIGDDAVTGFRLDRLEILNWGTFHEKVWSVRPHGRNALLTGDIGTGKSTLIDALTTLLVPSHRAAYNKAAGAAVRERTLRSYVLGHYKTERSEYSDATARPVALRSEDSYSVILGVFTNVGFMQTVTLAHVYWPAPGTGQPKRFYVGWEARDEGLAITGDFSGFGGDMRKLRKRLRAKGAKVWETFPKYGAWMRRRLGIHNEQALDLFHQTVSLKSVGNLTSFVRTHMLERFDARPRIEALIHHFDDLSLAHEAVLKAKRQIELLKPIAADADRHDVLDREISELEMCEKALAPYFAGLEDELLAKRIEGARQRLAKLEARRGRLVAAREAAQDKISSLKADIETSGGGHLNELTRRIAARGEELRRRRARATDYESLLGALEETVPDDARSFAAKLERLRNLYDRESEELLRLGNETGRLSADIRQAERDLTLREDELRSLRSRRSNIPAQQLRLRARLCEALGLDEASLPFAGELVAVRDEASEWEGAAERLLRSFGLAMLVSRDQYARISEWVDRSDLKGRLTYFRVLSSRRPRHPVRNDSLVRKLSVKPDSPHHGWIVDELARRFDVVCCDDVDQFRREPRAITRAGQVKLQGEQHRKDDRYSIHDRARFVLGWTNEAKIAVLQEQADELKSAVLAKHDSRREVEDLQKDCIGRTNDLARLREFSAYEDVDWRSVAIEIENLRQERSRIESASDVLRQLHAQLTDAQADLRHLEEKHDRAVGQIGGLKGRLDDLRSRRTTARSVLEDADLDKASRSYARLAVLLDEVSGKAALSLETMGGLSRRVESAVRERGRDRRGEAENVRRDMRRRMLRFNQAFPLETTEIDPDPAAAPEYRERLASLENDGLPAFERRFERLLNENTIQEVANFYFTLNREREAIRERIEQINESLAEIEFNPGRYIKIEWNRAPDPEVSAFWADLKACLRGTLEGSRDELYSRDKFESVKKIIGRLRGREGSADPDQRWTEKVTDVRNCFVFSASERLRADGTEYEHHTDSSGKSGGQKEKLAYTILAASLVYQFGLESGSNRSRAFRLVVIDEAFGRGSDDSAQFALDLFTRLHLQLVIVTPLQKIHVIEPFVQSVGFIEIRDGRDSRIRNLTIEEYREQKRLARETSISHGVPEVAGSAPTPAAVQPRA